MTSKNFIPEQLQKRKNQQPAESIGKPYDSVQKRETAENRFQMTLKKEPAETHSQMTQKREPMELRSQIESSRPKTAPQTKPEPTKSM